MQTCRLIQTVTSCHFEYSCHFRNYRTRVFSPANKHLQEVLQQVLIENFVKDLPLTYCVPKSRLLKQTINICWDNLV